jgi:hypothetical protein
MYPLPVLISDAGKGHGDTARPPSQCKLKYLEIRQHNARKCEEEWHWEWSWVAVNREQTIYRSHDLGEGLMHCCALYVMAQ